ncbi:hypothetical protein ACFL29_02010 [Patescibacteria group bacterium]
MSPLRSESIADLPFLFIKKKKSIDIISDPQKNKTFAKDISETMQTPQETIVVATKRKNKITNSPKDL